MKERSKYMYFEDADEERDIFCMAKKTFVMRKILNRGGGENSEQGLGDMLKKVDGFPFMGERKMVRR